MTTLKNWLKKNKKTVNWIIGILLAYIILFPDQTIELQSQSIFGFGGITITVGVILVAIMFIFIFAGVTAGPFLPIVLFTGFMLIAGGAVISELTNLFTSTIGIITIGVILVILYFIFIKK